MTIAAIVTWLGKAISAYGYARFLHDALIGLGNAFYGLSNRISPAGSDLERFERTLDNVRTSLDTHGDELHQLQGLYTQHAALTEKMRQAYIAYIKAQEMGNLDEASRQLLDLQVEYRNLNREISALESVTGAFDRNQLGSAIKMVQQEEQLKRLSAQWNLSAEEILQALDGMTLDEWAEAQEEQLRSLAEQWDICMDDITNAMQEQGISLDEWAAQQERAFAEWQAAVRAHTSNVVNGFRALPEEFDKTLEEMIQTLYENRRRYNEWTETMAQITAKYGEDVAYHLRQLGPAATAELQRMLDACEPYGPMLADLLRSIGADATAAGSEQFQQRKFVDAPSDGITKQAKAVSENTALSEAVEAVVSDAEQQFERMAEEASATTATMMTEVETIITDSAEPTRAAMETVRTGVEDEFDILRETLPKIMLSAMEGAYIALVRKGDVLIARAKAIAAAIAAIMASALGVNSPSRVMIDLFGKVMDGIYVGMDRGEDAVLKKAEGAWGIGGKRKRPLSRPPQMTCSTYYLQFLFLIFLNPRDLEVSFVLCCHSLYKR